MRATIKSGGRSVKVSTRREFDLEVSSAIFGTVNEEVIELSRPILRRMAAALKLAAMTEAYELLLNAADILLRGGSSSDTNQTFYGSGLAPSNRSGFLQQGLTGASSEGAVAWAPLTPKYFAEKRKHYPSNINRTLVRRGYLMEYLLYAHKSIVETRFGGVEVDVTDASEGLAGRKIPHYPESFDGSRSYTTTLGKIHIKIFPKISPSLLPGLASRRWTDTGNTYGAMERAMLPTTVSNKLAPPGGGSQLAYRPLILPLTQFWMLVRIPNAVGVALQKFAKKISIGENG